MILAGDQKNRMLIEMQVVVARLRRVSVGNKDSVGTWTGGHMYYALAENLFSFLLSHRTLWGAEIRSAD